MTISPQQISQLESRIGVELPPVSYDIEKGLIRRFAQAVGDANPLWQDEDYAREIGYQSLVAPPNLILTLGFDRVLEEFIADDSLTVLHGSTELECHAPVQAGDVITAGAKIANVRQRQGQTGATVFVTFEITYTNQRQQTVADCRQMAIIY
jgi:acyl dehydratase